MHWSRLGPACWRLCLCSIWVRGRSRCQLDINIDLENWTVGIMLDRQRHHVWLDFGPLTLIVYPANPVCDQ